MVTMTRAGLDVVLGLHPCERQVVGVLLHRPREGRRPNRALLARRSHQRMQTSIGSGLNAGDTSGETGDQRTGSRRDFGAVAVRSPGHNDLPAAG